MALSASFLAFWSEITRPVMSDVRIGWAQARVSGSHHLWLSTQRFSGATQPRVQTSIATLTTAKMPTNTSLTRSIVGFMGALFKGSRALLASRGDAHKLRRLDRARGLQTAPETLLAPTIQFSPGNFEALATHEGVGPGQAGD